MAEAHQVCALLALPTKPNETYGKEQKVSYGQVAVVL